MLKARTVLIASIVLVLLIVFTSLVNVPEPGDGGDGGKDTYGTEFYGFKGIYQTMQRLGIKVSRGFMPPSYQTGGADTVVLLSPSRLFAGLDPEFLRNLRTWADNGGRVVLAVKRLPGQDFSASKLRNIQQAPVVSLLGFAGIKTKRFKPRAGKGDGYDSEDVEDEESGGDGSEAIKDEQINGEKPESVKKKSHSGKYTRQVMNLEYVYSEYDHPVKAHVKGSGSLEWMVKDCNMLRLPAKPLYFDPHTFPEGMSAQGEIHFSAGEKEYLLAASFPVGKGEVVLVSDPAVFFNRYLAGDDNAVFAVRLLAAKGRSVLFDEFYHGLNVSGNALWLLHNYPYNLVAFFFLLAFALLTWRGYCRLGPALQGLVKTRRSLHEYVAAISALLGRADTRRDVLRELYEGGLWHIARSVDIRRRDLTAEYLAQRLERKDPQRAQALRRAAESMERILQQDQINLKDAIQAAKEMDITINC